MGHEAKRLWTNADQTIQLVHCSHCGEYTIEATPKHSALRRGTTLVEPRADSVCIAVKREDLAKMLRAAVFDAVGDDAPST